MSETDTSRTVVQTYVPAYQREEWDDHAEELGMSRSEFVKAMVQAGRKQFGTETGSEPDGSGEATALQSQILDVLEEHGSCSWDELLAGVTGDIETRLEECLQELQEADRIRYSGREGGYVVVDDE